MLLVVGRIVRPHGLCGEVIVEVRTDEPEDRFVPGRALITDIAEVGAAATARGAPARGAPAADTAGTRWVVPDALTVERLRWHQGRLLVTFAGVSDRDVADELRGVRLCVDSATVAPPDEPDEFHDHQLIGLAAVTPAGESLGEITGIDHAPGSDLLLLRRPDGRQGLVPFVKAIVPAVDLARGHVVVDPPDGLFDL